MSRRLLAILAGRAAAVLLMAGAAFHATGLPLARAGAAELTNEFLAATLEPIWLFASFHWLAFALMAAWLAGRGSLSDRLILAGMGVFVLLDTGQMMLALGGFVGTYVLGVSGLLCVLSAGLAKPVRVADQLS